MQFLKNGLNKLSHVKDTRSTSYSIVKIDDIQLVDQETSRGV